MKIKKKTQYVYMITYNTCVAAEILTGWSKHKLSSYNNRNEIRETQAFQRVNK